MTRSCSRWLLLVALLSAAPVYCQLIEDYGQTLLLAIKNNESGLEIFTLFPENRGSVNSIEASQWPNYVLESQILFIPGHNLSSECGDQYFRCQELLVITESLFIQNMDRSGRGSLNVVFVPLEDGVLLLTYLYSSNNIMSVEWSIFIVSSFSCSPTVFYNINSIIYMVCINLYEEYIAVYEIQLNLSSSGVRVAIEGATLIEQLTIISFSTSSSNFITADHRIYFAIGNTIIAVDVSDMTQTQQYPELPGCAQIYNIVPVTGAGNKPLLVANCTDKYVYFDPEYGDWTMTQLLSNNEVLYLCPDKYKITHYISGILQFSERDMILNTVNNVSISSGVCFESQNITYFAYSNQQHSSAFVYDFIRRRHYVVSSYVCSQIYQDCPRLLILSNQYLIVQDSNHDLVLDATTNFSVIFNISSGMADILAILHNNVYSPITPSPPINLTTSFITVSPGVHIPNSNLVGIILTVVIGLFAIIVILVTVAVGFSIQQCRRSKWCNCNVYRIPRRVDLRLKLSHCTNESAPVPLLAFDGDQEEEEIEWESMAEQSGLKITRL